MLNADFYRAAVQKALAGIDPVDVPSMECVDLILRACERAEFADKSLIAVTWRRESLWYQHPVSNPRHDGGADVGCLQLATTYWDKAPFADGLSNPFGTTRTKTEPFDGDPLENLIVGCRAYIQLLKRAKGDRGVAAGLYRAGQVNPDPSSAYAVRHDEFMVVVASYDAFFAMPLPSY